MSGNNVLLVSAKYQPCRVWYSIAACSIPVMQQPIAMLLLSAPSSVCKLDLFY